jgi:hypothetical protein
MAPSLQPGSTVRLRSHDGGSVYRVEAIAPGEAGPVCLLNLLSYVSTQPEGIWEPPHELALAPAESLEVVAYDPADQSLPPIAQSWNDWLAAGEAA